jgi:hypothetical protein
LFGLENEKAEAGKGRFALNPSAAFFYSLLFLTEQTTCAIHFKYSNGWKPVKLFL